MRKLSAFALVAGLSIALVSTAAEAAVRRPPPSPTSNGNGPVACVVDCLTISNAGPSGRDCLPVRGPVTLAPLADARIIVHPRCRAAGSFAACGQKLGNLRRVTVNQVRRIDDNDSVHLVPICDVVHRTLTEEETSFLARGNVQGLVRPIGQNETLEAALEDGGYRADDVIGIVLDPRAVTLYVSRARAGR